MTRGDLVRDISADGKVVSANSSTLYAIANGMVTLHVVAGDTVKKGQALAEIDSPTLRSNLVQEESTLGSLEAEVNKASLDIQLAQSAGQKNIDNAKIEHAAAERDLERYQSGYDKGAISLIDLMKAKDSLQKSDIDLDHAKDDAALLLKAAQLSTRNKNSLAERQRAVVSEARRQVEGLTLRAPFDGQVGQVHVSQYTNVSQNSPVLSVIDLTFFEVEFSVPESFARDLSIGMPAEITNGSGKKYTAKVAAVAPEVINGEVAGRLRFTDEQPSNLRQSQRLNVRVFLDTRKDVLMVERGPFVDQGGGRYAYVMNGDIAVRKQIDIGASNLSQVEVTRGLSVDDRVVVSGADLFGTVERVKIN